MTDSVSFTMSSKITKAIEKLKNVPILTADVKRATANGHHITRLASH